jgi:hypothetical protein
MGTIQHDAIIVTGRDYKNHCPVKRLHNVAKIIFPSVSDILESGTNGYQSFFVPPDGSKEMWEESDTGDERRKIFIDIASKCIDCDVISVSYGECGYSLDKHRIIDGEY